MNASATNPEGQLDKAAPRRYAVAAPIAAADGMVISIVAISPRPTCWQNQIIPMPKKNITTSPSAHGTARRSVVTAQLPSMFPDWALALGLGNPFVASLAGPLGSQVLSLGNCLQRMQEQLGQPLPSPLSPMKSTTCRTSRGRRATQPGNKRRRRLRVAS